MSVEEIEEELYKVLHKDFIRFQSELQKCSQNTNYICENDIKRIIENLLGYNMTKCQWIELQSHFNYKNCKEEIDGDENQNRLVDFRKFLDIFNNPMNVCRYQKKSVPNDYADWMKRRDHKVNVYDPPRKSNVLCRLVADILKYRFHAIDKYYKAFGTGIRGSFTREILHDLLNSQKCKLSPDEMEVIWAVVEADPNYTTWDYRQILKHLMMNLYKRAEELTIQSRKLKLSVSEDSNIEVLKTFRHLHKDDKAKREAADLHKIDMALNINSRIADVDLAKSTIEKIAPLMLHIWVPFKKQLRKIDILGNATIELFEMKVLLNKYNLLLTKDEMENILRTFDLKKNGRFHYIAFLKEFVKYTPEEPTKMSELHFNKMRHQVFNKLMKEWKSLIRAFRKLDTNKTSKLDIEQLNGVLIKAGFRLSDDDLYHLFTEFDTNLDGKIDYVEFIEQLLDVQIDKPE